MTLNHKIIYMKNHEYILVFFIIVIKKAYKNYEWK